ncbi:hypothetical protein Tco_0764392 [Tanacetum coccineum]
MVMASSSLTFELDTINLLSKNDIVNDLPKLKFVKDHFCSSCGLRKAKRNSFKRDCKDETPEVLVIVDDYSRYTWTHFLRSKDETREVLIDFLRMIQRGLQAQSKGYEVYNKRTRLIVETSVAKQEQTVNANENINQAENVMVDEDEFINIFGTPVHEVRESSSHHVDPSNMHTFYQPHPSKYHWTKDHPLEQVLRNPSQLVRTRRQLDTDGEKKKESTSKNYLHQLLDKKQTLDYQSPRGVFINQAKYAQKILKKHGMTSCDSIGTPMATKPLDADLSGIPVDQTKYHSMVRSLMYLTASRPDIVHATCYCARYQARSIEKHLKEVKQIFRYLKNTIRMGLCYPKDIDFKLTSFSDSDHVERGIVELFFVETGYQLADLFTKALSQDRFNYLCRRLCIRSLTPAELEALTNESA